MRMAVAFEKAFQSQNVAIVGPADDHRPARTFLQEPNATQDQRAHDPLPQFGFLDHQVAQARRRHKDRFHVADGNTVRQRGASGELRQFPHETAVTVGDDRLVMGVVRAHAHFAGQNDVKSLRRVPRLKDVFAPAIAAKLAETTQPVDLGFIQTRKHLVAARFRDRSQILGHFDPFSAGGDKTRYWACTPYPDCRWRGG
jgi:hypothetical protein